MCVTVSVCQCVNVSKWCEEVKYGGMYVFGHGVCPCGPKPNSIYHSAGDDDDDDDDVLSTRLLLDTNNDDQAHKHTGAREVHGVKYIIQWGGR